MSIRPLSKNESKGYIGFLRAFNHCWACGLDGSYSNMPEDWFAGWGIDRAHIVNHPRVKSRYVIAALCSLCHKRQHRIRVVTASRPLDWPNLTLPNLIWLKERFDPEYFDLSVLQRYAVGRLPDAAAPPDCYLDELVMRRPELERRIRAAA